MILETVDETSAYFQLHPGAVYLHQGEAFRVADLDLENGAAYVSRTDSTYYTQSKDTTDITINRVRSDKFAGGVQVYLGDVEVTTRVTGYQRRRPLTEEVLGEEWLDLPPRIFNTVALWFDIPDQFLEEVDGKKLDLAGKSPCGRTRDDRCAPSVRAVRPERHRGRIHTPAPRHKAAPDIHIRRPPRRHRNRRDGLPDGWTALECHIGCRHSMPLRRRLSQLHSVTQMRQQQLSSGQGRRGPPLGNGRQVMGV